MLAASRTFGVVHGVARRRPSRRGEPVDRQALLRERVAVAHRHRALATLSWSIVTHHGVPISSWRR